MDHNCVIIKNRFKAKNDYYCHLCGQMYITIDDAINGEQEVLLDIYNRILDDDRPLETAEAVLVLIESKIANYPS